MMLLVARISPVVPDAAVPIPREPNCGAAVVPVISANVQVTLAEPFTDLPVEPRVNVLAVVQVAAEVADVADVAVEALPTKLAVIVFALKLPEASRATIVEAPFELEAFDVTVNVLLPAWSAVNVAEPDKPVPDTFIVNVPLFGADNATQAESPRRNVDELGVPVAARRATGAVPLARAEAFNEVIPEPAPVTVVNVPVFAVKLPEASRAIIVEDPLAEAAVVLALSRVPLEILDALIAVMLPPAPVIVVNVPTLAVKLPEASRATIVEAPFELDALESTVNVVLPAWSAVNVAEPDKPVPDVFKVNVPLFGADKAAQVESPRK